jgi:hypothetical protein
MFGRHAPRRSLKRSSRPESHLSVESLEERIVLTASIGFDARQGIVSIIGSEAGDVASVSQQGKNVVVSLTGVTSKTYKASQVKLFEFKGFGGDDSFTNNTSIRSRADGGAGRDTLRGGSGVDDLRGGGDDDRLFGNLGNDLLYGGGGSDTIDGGAGNDREYGEAGDDHLYGGVGDDALYGGSDNDDVYGDSGNDSLYGEAGDDHLDGRTGRDRIYGGAGLDREDDSDDRFSDGDDDGDGYDNDHDRPVNPVVATPITFTETESGVSTAQVTGESTNERDRDYYSFTATATQTLTVTVAADTNGRYAELEVKNGTTGRKLLELEPSENGVASAQLPVIAGSSYVIVVHSPFDYVAVGYTVDFRLDNSTISPIIGTEVVFDATGLAQLTGTVVGEHSKRMYSFTATTTGSLNVSLLPDANGRYAELEVANRTTRRKLLELEPSERYGRTSGTIAVVAGQTYVIEVESPFDRVTVDFMVNLQLR